MADYDDGKLAASKEQLQREAEARARRIARRKEPPAKQSMDSSLRKFVRTSFVSVFWFGLIGSLFLAIAWNWPEISTWLTRSGF